MKIKCILYISNYNKQIPICCPLYYTHNSHSYLLNPEGRHPLWGQTNWR